MKNSAFAITVAIAIALASGCGGGDDVAGNCASLCAKFEGQCLQSEPAQIAECEQNCVTDGEASDGCGAAIADMDACVVEAACATLLTGAACVAEVEAVTVACPNANPGSF